MGPHAPIVILFSCSVYGLPEAVVSLLFFFLSVIKYVVLVTIQISLKTIFKFKLIFHVIIKKTYEAGINFRTGDFRIYPD